MKMIKHLTILAIKVLLGVIALLFGLISITLYFGQHMLDQICPVSAKGSVIISYDGHHEPIDINSNAIMAQLSGVKNRLFFLSCINDGINNGIVAVNYDGSLLTNGYYAQRKVSWIQLKSTTGEELIYTPKTAIRNNNIHTPLYESNEIVIRDKKSKPVYAEGAVDLQIPCKFMHVEFNSSEINATHVVGKYSVKLISCLRDRAELQIKGLTQKEILQQELTQMEVPIIVFREADGMRIKQLGGQMIPGPQCTFIEKAGGYIAKIVVYFPVEFADFKFSTRAMRKG